MRKNTWGAALKQNILILALLVVVAAGAFAVYRVQSGLQADLIELEWRVTAAEAAVAEADEGAVSEVAAALNALAEELRAGLAAATARATAASEAVAELEPGVVGAAEQAAAIAAQIEGLQAILGTLDARLTEVETRTAPPPEPEETAEVDPAALDGDGLAGLDGAGEAASPVAEALGVEDLGTDEIVILVSDTTWVRVVSDVSGPVFEGLLEPDDAVRLPADEQPIVVRLGNGGQVFALVNDAVRGPFGNLGTVVERAAIDAAAIVDSLPEVDPERLSLVRPEATADAGGTQTGPTIIPVPRP